MSITARVLDVLLHPAFTIKTFVDAGLIRPLPPDQLLKVVLTMRRWGNTPPRAIPRRRSTTPMTSAIIDELGSLTFAEVHRRTNALASALREEGLKAGDSVGVMCRNHRGFIEAIVALSKLGCHTLLLNTGFAGPQLADVCKREGAEALIYDAEFASLLKDAARNRRRFVAWHDRGDRVDVPTLEELIETGDDSDLDPPREPGRTVILTSGTTGTPKGAGRSQPKNLDPAVSLLSTIPLRSRDLTLIAAPCSTPGASPISASGWCSRRRC